MAKVMPTSEVWWMVGMLPYLAYPKSQTKVYNSCESKGAHQLTYVTGNAVGSPDADPFKPSRRVRTVPGGPQSFTLGDGSEDVFAAAPSKACVVRRYLCVI